MSLLTEAEPAEPGDVLLNQMIEDELAKPQDNPAEAEAEPAEPEAEPVKHRLSLLDQGLSPVN
jgi:hypothetical protein